MTLMPGVGGLALQDYQILNGAPQEAMELLEKIKGVCNE